MKDDDNVVTGEKYWLGTDMLATVTAIKLFSVRKTDLHQIEYPPASVNIGPETVEPSP